MHIEMSVKASDPAIIEFLAASALHQAVINVGIAHITIEAVLVVKAKAVSLGRRGR
jgi:hypothetical protein